jgi:hypothetical protein
MKTYKTEAAARKAGPQFTQLLLTEDNITEYSSDRTMLGRWVNTTDTPPAPLVSGVPEVMEPVSNGVQDDLPMDPEEHLEPAINTLVANRGRSTVEKPVPLVHRVTRELRALDPKTPRKDIVAVCINMGVNHWTARTQVQIALAALKKEAAAATLTQGPGEPDA